MQDKVDIARERVLDQMIDWAGIKRIDTAPGHLRNLAAVYQILTESRRVATQMHQIVGADGVTYYYDAFGAAIDPEVAMKRLRGE